MPLIVSEGNGTISDLFDNPVSMYENGDGIGIFFDMRDGYRTSLLHADGVETIAVLEFIAVGCACSAISFRLSHGRRAYGWHRTDEYFVARLNVMCAFYAFSG